MDVAVISSGEVKFSDITSEQGTLSTDPMDTPPPKYDEIDYSDSNRSATKTAAGAKPEPESSRSVEEADDEQNEEKTLTVLRDIIRKCTNANPMKRPTAGEVLKMLEAVTPPELYSEFYGGAERHSRLTGPTSVKKLK